LADEEAWKMRFDEKRDAIGAWRVKPLTRTSGARHCGWTICINVVAHDSHPGLQFKKFEGEDEIYSARIGLGYPGSSGHEEGSRGLVLDRQSLLT
jgi:hypothetical protein